MPGLVFLAELSGWLVAALIVVTIGIALFARRHLAQHFWIGYAIGSLAFIHAGLSMGGTLLASATAVYGVLVATVAMCVSWVQVLLGTRLRVSTGRTRVLVRALHVVTATALVSLAAAHVLLSGPVVRGLLGL